jgi:hypothetical protein
MNSLMRKFEERYGTQQPVVKVRRAKRRVCMIDGCGRVARVRGVCLTCYSASRAAIARGTFTEAQLVELGLIRARTVEPTAWDKAVQTVG